MCCGACLFAQERAQISGTVTDQSGAVIPDVEVSVTQNATGLKRSATSDNKGFFIIPDLPLGPYNLQAAKMGFRTFVRPDVVRQVGTNPESVPRFRISGCSSRTDAEQKAAVRKVVEAGNLFGQGDRVVLGHQTDPGAELSVLVTAAAAASPTNGSSEWL